MDMRSSARNLPDADPDLAIIRPNVLVHVLRHAENLGIDSRGWFAGLGFDREQLIDPEARLSYRQVRTLLRRAIAGCEQPGLGLLIGSSESLGVFGLLGLLMMTAETFGEAVRLGIENHEVSGSLLDMSFAAVGEDEAALVVWPRYHDPEMQPFLTEEITASCLAAARELVGAGFGLRRVELAYAPPPHAPLYPRILGASTRFNAAISRVVFDAGWLATELAGYNPLASRQARELCQRQLRAIHDRPAHAITATVERMLRTRINEHLRIEDVADELNLSERSLRRQLTRAGTSFRAIHDAVRTAWAYELLRAGDMPITTIAATLGFSDGREFRRAFKRWTGITPQAARNSTRAAAVDRFATPARPI